MSELEAVLAGLSLFEHLRADEVARIARRFEIVTLATQEQHAAADDPRLAIVIAGTVNLDVTEGEIHLHARMTTGDRFGMFSMATGIVKPFTMTARTPAILAFKLEKQLFKLVPGDDPNPVHVHHFNYGLFLIATAGLIALFPHGRRML